MQGDNDRNKKTKKLITVKPARADGMSLWGVCRVYEPRRNEIAVQKQKEITKSNKNNRYVVGEKKTRIAKLSTATTAVEPRMYSGYVVYSYRGVWAAGTCVHCARERGSGSTRGGYWVLVQQSTVIRNCISGPKHQAPCTVHRTKTTRAVYTPTPILHSMFPASVSLSEVPLMDPRLCWRMRSVSLTTVWYSNSSTRPCGAAISM